MRIYQFDGDNYCGPCGEAIAATLPKPNEWEREHPDSCSYPVAYDSSTGESDTPDHCLQCGDFLERNLTNEGRQYVQNYVDTLDGDTDITLLWGEFYGIEREVA
jgi:hypothetical protein